MNKEDKERLVKLLGQNKLTKAGSFALHTYIRDLEDCNKDKDKEIKRLKNGYCELKVKCNNGECDCTNEEYDGMVQCNIKLSLENDELRNILEKMGTNPNEILYLKNEVDELNNIINELEKWLEENIKISKAHDNQLGVNVCNTFLDKLKELKEGMSDE